MDGIRSKSLPTTGAETTEPGIAKTEPGIGATRSLPAYLATKGQSTIVPIEKEPLATATQPRADVPTVSSRPTDTTVNTNTVIATTNIPTFTHQKTLPSISSPKSLPVIGPPNTKPTIAVSKSMPAFVSTKQPSPSNTSEAPDPGIACPSTLSTVASQKTKPVIASPKSLSLPAIGSLKARTIIAYPKSMPDIAPTKTQPVTASQNRPPTISYPRSLPALLSPKAHQTIGSPRSLPTIGSNKPLSVDQPVDLEHAVVSPKTLPDILTQKTQPTIGTPKSLPAIGSQKTEPVIMSARSMPAITSTKPVTDNTDVVPGADISSPKLQENTVSHHTQPTIVPHMSMPTIPSAKPLSVKPPENRKPVIASPMSLPTIGSPKTQIPITSPKSLPAFTAATIHPFGTPTATQPILTAHTSFKVKESTKSLSANKAPSTLLTNVALQPMEVISATKGNIPTSSAKSLPALTSHKTHRPAAHSDSLPNIRINKPQPVSATDDSNKHYPVASATHKRPNASNESLKENVDPNGLSEAVSITSLSAKYSAIIPLEKPDECDIYERSVSNALREGKGSADSKQELIQKINRIREHSIMNPILSRPSLHKLRSHASMSSVSYQAYSEEGLPRLDMWPTKYLKRDMGMYLIPCLKDVCEARPRDPIEYIAHWLYKSVDAELYFYKRTIFNKECMLLVQELNRRQTKKTENLKKINHIMKALKRDILGSKVQERRIVSELVNKSMFRRKDIKQFEANYVRNLSDEELNIIDEIGMPPKDIVQSLLDRDYEHISTEELTQDHVDEQDPLSTTETLYDTQADQHLMSVLELHEPASFKDSHISLPNYDTNAIQDLNISLAQDDADAIDGMAITTRLGGTDTLQDEKVSNALSDNSDVEDLTISTATHDKDLNDALILHGTNGSDDVHSSAPLSDKADDRTITSKYWQKRDPNFGFSLEKNEAFQNTPANTPAQRTSAKSNYEQQKSVQFASRFVTVINQENDRRQNILVASKEWISHASDMLDGAMAISETETRGLPKDEIMIKKREFEDMVDKKMAFMHQQRRRRRDATLRTPPDSMTTSSSKSSKKASLEYGSMSTVDYDNDAPSWLQGLPTDVVTKPRKVETNYFQKMMNKKKMESKIAPMQYEPSVGSESLKTPKSAKKEGGEKESKNSDDFKESIDYDELLDDVVYLESEISGPESRQGILKRVSDLEKEISGQTPRNHQRRQTIELEQQISRLTSRVGISRQKSEIEHEQQISGQTLRIDLLKEKIELEQQISILTSRIDISREKSELGLELEQEQQISGQTPITDLLRQKLELEQKISRLTSKIDLSRQISELELELDLKQEQQISGQTSGIDLSRQKLELFQQLSRVTSITDLSRQKSELEQKISGHTSRVDRSKQELKLEQQLSQLTSRIDKSRHISQPDQEQQIHGQTSSAGLSRKLSDIKHKKKRMVGSQKELRKHPKDKKESQHSGDYDELLDDVYIESGVSGPMLIDGLSEQVSRTGSSGQTSRRKLSRPITGHGVSWKDFEVSRSDDDMSGDTLHTVPYDYKDSQPSTEYDEFPELPIIEDFGSSSSSDDLAYCTWAVDGVSLICDHPVLGKLKAKGPRSRSTQLSTRPSVWLQRRFHCRVFYQDEIYVNCDIGDSYSSTFSSRSSRKASRLDMKVSRRTPVVPGKRFVSPSKLSRKQSKRSPLNVSRKQSESTSNTSRTLSASTSSISRKRSGLPTKPSRKQQRSPSNLSRKLSGSTLNLSRKKSDSTSNLSSKQSGSPSNLSRKRSGSTSKLSRKQLGSTSNISRKQTGSTSNMSRKQPGSMFTIPRNRSGSMESSKSLGTPSKEGLSRQTMSGSHEQICRPTSKVGRSRQTIRAGKMVSGSRKKKGLSRQQPAPELPLVGPTPPPSLSRIISSSGKEVNDSNTAETSELELSGQTPIVVVVSGDISRPEPGLCISMSKEDISRQIMEPGVTQPSSDEQGVFGSTSRKRSIPRTVSAPEQNIHGSVSKVGPEQSVSGSTSISDLTRQMSGQPQAASSPKTKMKQISSVDLYVAQTNSNEDRATISTAMHEVTELRSKSGFTYTFQERNNRRVKVYKDNKNSSPTPKENLPKQNSGPEIEVTKPISKDGISSQISGQGQDIFEPMSRDGISRKISGQQQDVPMSRDGISRQISGQCQDRSESSGGLSRQISEKEQEAYVPMSRDGISRQISGQEQSLSASTSRDDISKQLHGQGQDMSKPISSWGLSKLLSEQEVPVSTLGMSESGSGSTPYHAKEK